MPLDKEGDWNLVSLLIKNLKREMSASRKIGLKQMALKMEGTAKKHMGRQDLGWIALKPSTLAQKARLGLSEHTLIATSTYFQSITGYVKGGKALAGVKRQVKSNEGQLLANIAKIHEYGGGKIPKRPLWLPTITESVQWYAIKQPHLKALNKRLAKYKA